MKAIKLIIATVVAGSLLSSEAAQGGGFWRRALNEEAKEALVAALAGPNGEYAAHAQYSAVLKKFGDVQPYASIIKAEENHIAALKRQLDKYGIPIPTNRFEGSVAAPETLAAAAKEAVASEERNAAMYDEALKSVSGRPDLVRVFTRLRDASRDAHLLAFKATLATGGKFEKGEAGCCGMGCCGRGNCRMLE